MVWVEVFEVLIFFFSWDAGMTAKVSSFDNWKLQMRMRVSACVLVDCNILTVTPDSFLSFFILVFRQFANNLHYMLSHEGVSFWYDSCRVCTQHTDFPL